MFHRNEKKLQTYLHKHFWSVSMLIVRLKRFIHYHVKRHKTKNRECSKNWIIYQWYKNRYFRCHLQWILFLDLFSHLYVVCLKGMLNTTHTATECAYQVFDGWHFCWIIAKNLSSSFSCIYYYITDWAPILHSCDTQTMSN